MVYLLEFPAGSEILDKQIHQQYRAIGDGDEDGCKGTGNAVGALFRELVDLDGDQQELRGHQQDNGGNGGDAPDKGCYQAAEEGILDQRQGHSHEHPEAVGTHVIGRFFDALVNLPQGGNAASGTGGQRPDHENNDQNGGAAVNALEETGAEDTVDKAADIADAQNRAGNRHGQHGYEFDEALGFELSLDHQVRDDHAQKRGDGCRGQGQQEGIPEGFEALVLLKDPDKPFGCQAEVIAPGLEQGTERHADIHHDDKQRNQGTQNCQRDSDRLIFNEHSGSGCLAGEGCGSFGFQNIFLHQIHSQRDGQQHHSHGSGTFLVKGTGNLQINCSSQGIIGTADDHGVGKVRNGLDEGHQEGIAQARQNQGQGDIGEYLEPGGAHIPGGFLQGGVDVLQKTLEHHIAHREEGQGLDDGDTPEAIDAVIINLQQVPGDDAGLAEEHDHGQGQHKGRRNHRQHGNHLEQSAHEFAPDFHIDLHIGKQQAKDRGENAHGKTNLQCVGNGCTEGMHAENPLENIQCQAGFITVDTVHQQNRQRVENE